MRSSDFFRILSIQIPLVNLTDLCKKFGTRWHTCAKSTIFQIWMYKTKLTETTWIAFITFTSSCCFRLSPCYWLVLWTCCSYLPMQNIFFNAHSQPCKHLIYSILQSFYRNAKVRFGGQAGGCIFAKKPIKSAKTHFFLEFLAYLHFVAWLNGL